MFCDRRSYVTLILNFRCYSAVGRQGGEQLVSIGNGCAHTRTVMHELMHAIGFFHENSRNDRDYFVKVLWWNIQHGKISNQLKGSVSSSMPCTCRLLDCLCSCHFMAHENGDKQRPTKRRHVQGMLDETDPFNLLKFKVNFPVGCCCKIFDSEE